ncbi:MAG: nucleotide-binding protein, partial [Chlorobi bacterium]|nr:nucleotide-binding protein [Chlorobiota bacterium]
ATVTFEGVVATDKDFGAGYFYPVILENAKVIK